MSSFRPYKRRRSIVGNALWVGATVVGVVILWLIIRAIIGSHKEELPLASATTLYNTLLPKSVLVRKITEQQTILESYDAQLTTATLLAKENDALKAELGRSERSTGVLAHVKTLPNRSFYDTFVIDAGLDQSITVGQVVYGFGSIALGTVSDVADDHATVTLFSAPERTTSGTASGSDVAVTLIGRGGGEYEVRLPRDLQFTTGQLIAYQSTESTVLAEIERILTDARDPFQRLIAKAPINLQALKWVIVR